MRSSPTGCSAGWTISSAPRASAWSRSSTAHTRYAALTYKGGAAWRRELARDLGGFAGIRELLDELDDDGLHALPFAGHKHNHAGLMSREQMAIFQRAMGVAEGQGSLRRSRVTR